jgi:Ca2+:H+ antiporter
VARIGLTVPTVAAIAWWTGNPLALGVSSGGAVLLALSIMMALITYGTGRATLVSGVVHLILLAIWLFLIVAP